MTDFKLAGLGFQAPSDYRARMIVITAPQKEAPKTGHMVVKQQSSFARNVVIACEDVAEGTTLEQYAEKQLTTLKQTLPGFKLLGQGTTTVGGVTCPMIEAQSTGPEGRLLNSMTVYALDGRTAYTLSASNLAGLPYQDSKKEYLSIMESFRFR